jgi:choline dehydrogenase
MARQVAMNSGRAVWLWPLSRGYVEAKSNRPGDAPAINPRYLSEQGDRRAIVGGLCLVRLIFAAPALQPFVRQEACRDCRCRSKAPRGRDRRR